MKLSARLILLLTFSVSVVMAVASLITLRQRESALLDAARDEARVHAVTLQIALEEDYLTGRSLDAQRLINRLRENTGVYSAALFDATGEIVAISNTLAPEEFLRRFLLHVLPSGFHKIRHFGLYSSGAVRTRLEKARLLLGDGDRNRGEDEAPPAALDGWADLMRKITGEDPLRCPVCGQGRLVKMPLPEGWRPRGPP